MHGQDLDGDVSVGGGFAEAVARRRASKKPRLLMVRVSGGGVDAQGAVVASSLHQGILFEPVGDEEVIAVFVVDASVGVPDALEQVDRGLVVALRGGERHALLDERHAVVAFEIDEGVCVELARRGPRRAGPSA